ncbi:MAG: M3 family oligoendopeptidase, partial [Planctomycetes bacterium]|nr:M3 family oligoendopeptidase [Planctomycetota bacterium]
MTDQRQHETDLSAFPHYQPRRFVLEGADLTDKAVVVDLHKALLSRELRSGEDLEAWIGDLSELTAAVDEAGSILYVRMTCQTDDAERANRYKAFMTHVVPAVRPLGHALNAKYLAAREQFGAAGPRYEVYDRTTRMQVRLFREANVPLQTDLSLLSQEYQTLCGAMTVTFDGKERTLPQMARYQHETDRDVRQRAWQATTDRRLQDKDALEALFDRMLALRARVAANADFPSFREYSFAERNRFDYTPQDCLAYHDAVEAVVVPLWRDIQQRRRERMGLESLRPWDTSVDPEGRGPLKPFAEPSELINGCAEVFARTDPQLGRQFAMMRDAGLLDLASRKGKAPGGYATTLAEARRPFIFM